MAKRRKKRSPAQIAATKKMLRANKRARLAKKGGKRRKSSGRKRARKTVAVTPMAPPKRRRKARKGGKRRRAKIKATVVAPKRKRRAGRRKARKSGGHRKSPKRVAAGKKAARTRKRRKAAKAGSSKRSRKRKARKTGKRRASAKRSRTGGTRKRRRSRKTKRAVSFRLPRKAKKVYVVAAERRRRRHRRHHGRRSGAMENPMDATELFLGSLFGLVGFLAGDVTDRLIATHKLVDTGTKNAAGLEVYGDNPPTTGSYAGLFNPTAICAPMNLPRWANAVFVPGVVFLTAKYVQSKNVRAALQFGAFGYMARTVGKGLIDAVAMLVRPTQMGQQLYDGEMRAQLLKSNGGNNQAQAVKDLPAAGFGQTKQLAAAPCKCGGSCKECKERVTPVAGTGKPGTGYPSMPREVSPTAPTGNTANANAPIPPPATRPAPPATVPTQQPQSPTQSSLFVPQFLSGPKFKPFGGVDY